MPVGANMFLKSPIILSPAFLLLFGCGGSPSPAPKSTEQVAVAEAPLGALKNLAKALESPNAADRKKAAEEIAKLGAPTRPLQQSLKKAIEREPDVGVKAALTTALDKSSR
jgi:hypothetical protein